MMTVGYAAGGGVRRRAVRLLGTGPCVKAREARIGVSIISRVPAERGCRRSGNISTTLHCADALRHKESIETDTRQVVPSIRPVHTDVFLVGVGVFRQIFDSRGADGLRSFFCSRAQSILIDR